MRFIGTDVDISVEEMLNRYIPKIYSNSKTVKEINRVDAIELENIYSIVNNILDQFFVETATWGLELWEREYDIPTDTSLDYDSRRKLLYTKMNVKASFSKESATNMLRQITGNPDAEFIEIPRQYSFITKFNVEDEVDFNVVRNAFKTLKPAHLFHIVGQIIKEKIDILNTIESSIKIKVKSRYDAESIGEADSVLAPFLLDGGFILDGTYILNGDASRHNNGFVNVRESLKITYKKNNQNDIEIV